MTDHRQLGRFEEAVLMVLLRLGDNAYGVSISDELENRLEREVSIGAVYTTLARMKRKGYVSSRIGEPTPERGGRAKKFYKLEALGEHALKEAHKVAVQVKGDWAPVGA